MKCVENMLKQVQNEPNTLYYNFSFNHDKTKAYVREGYKNGQAMIYHLTTAAEKVKAFAPFCKFTKVECRGTKEDWEVAKGHAEPMGAEFWEIAKGGTFNRNVAISKIHFG